MKAIAEFIMRGRMAAALLAFIFAGLPMFTWLAAATVVLVTLRKGMTEGAFILLASLAPTLLIGDIAGLVTVSSMVVAYVGAAVLRSTVSLSYSVLSLVFASALLMGGLVSQSDGLLDLLKQILESQLAQLDLSETAGMKQSSFVHFMAVQTIGYGVGFTSLAGLFVGRWWQAVLFNPGGFQKEFHELRLSPFVTVAIALLYVGGVSGMGATGDTDSEMSLNMAAIASLLTLPLLVTGAAIVHSLVKVRQAGSFWLIGFYITLPVTNTMVYLMVLVDGVVDIRRKVIERIAGE